MSQPTSPLVLHLPYQSPWEWRQFHQHFALRLLAGVESLGDDHYARSFRANGRPAWFEVRPLAERQVLALSLSPSAHALAAELEARVRRMFDLDSDPAAIARHFAGDPLLGPLVAANPGLRLPVAFDPFEQAVRAIVGQQVTVKAAVTIPGRLTQRLGEPLEDLGYDGISHLFPTPAALAQANLDGIGMPGKRVQTLQRFAAAIASGELSLDLADGPEALVDRRIHSPACHGRSRRLPRRRPRPAEIHGLGTARHRCAQPEGPRRGLAALARLRRDPPVEPLRRRRLAPRREATA